MKVLQMSVVEKGLLTSASSMEVEVVSVRLSSDDNLETAHCKRHTATMTLLQVCRHSDMTLLTLLAGSLGRD